MIGQFLPALYRYQAHTIGKAIEGDGGTFALNETHSRNATDFYLWQGTSYGMYKASTALSDARTITEYQRVKYRTRRLGHARIKQQHFDELLAKVHLRNVRPTTRLHRLHAI
jgi:hypothetical protein